MRSTNARHLLLSLVFLISACGSDTAAAFDFSGTWVDPSAEHGHVLEVDGPKNKFLLHGPGHGGQPAHDHFEGGWHRDQGAFVLTGVWESTSKHEVVRVQPVGASLHASLGGKAVQLVRKP
jgi:hypothetical protein